jgi:hypothetical protein
MLKHMRRLNTYVFTKYKLLRTYNALLRKSESKQPNYLRRFDELLLYPYSESYLGVICGYDRTTNVQYLHHRKCSYRGFKSASQ